MQQILEMAGLIWNSMELTSMRFSSSLEAKKQAAVDILLGEKSSTELDR